MKEMLEALRDASRQAIEDAVDMDALEALRVRYLGKKGELTAILKQMGKLSAEERPVIGQLANAVRAELENELDSRKAALAAKLQEMKLEAETLDVSIPGKELRLGKKHVLNTVLDEVTDIFVGMGFTIAERITEDMLDVHFEKARADVPGAYPMLAREFARLIRGTMPGIRYLNREEDMGQPNLRKAKTEWYPLYLLEKNTAVWRDGQ